MNKRNLNYSQIKSIVLLGVSIDLEENVGSGLTYITDTMITQAGGTEEDIDSAKRYVLKLAEELYRRSEKASDKEKQCQS